MLGALVALAVFAACAYFMIAEFSRGLAKLGVDRFGGKNSSETAKDYFKKLLRAAERKMIIYDDGNHMEDSLYADGEVIAAVREKLVAFPEFSVQCFFNDDEELPFRDELAGHARVEIRTGTGNASRDTHCKIIDDGRMDYLSTHDHGDPERDYEVIDCMLVPDKHLGRVARKELGEHIDNFSQKFSAAAA